MSDQLATQPLEGSLRAADDRRLAVWSDISRASTKDSAAIEALLYGPIDFLLARPDQLAELHVPNRVGRAALASGAGTIDAAADQAPIVVVEDPELLPLVHRTDRLAGLRSVISDAASLEAHRQAAADADVLIVRLADATNIPLELLIAEAQGSRARVVKEVERSEDALVAGGVLESGPSGVLFQLGDLDEVVALNKAIGESEKRQLDLVPVRVTNLKHVGMGYRGCVDTISLFEKDEGMIVGSTSHGGLLVCAEVHHLPYMNLRPFRVNAGAVHSYLWGPDLSEYITDLSPGSRVLAVNTKGVARPVAVGRVKIEVRPLRLLEARAEDGTELNLFIQDDWHVRIFDADGLPRNCTTVEVGDRLLAHVCEPGRHVGIKVDETIDER